LPERVVHRQAPTPFTTERDRSAHVVFGQFAMKNLTDGEVTRFALSYAIDGALAEVPLSVSYQPRWWMQVDLALSDDVDSPSMGAWTGNREDRLPEGTQGVWP